LRTGTRKRSTRRARRGPGRPPRARRQRGAREQTRRDARATLSASGRGGARGPAAPRRGRSERDRRHRRPRDYLTRGRSPAPIRLCPSRRMAAPLSFCSRAPPGAHGLAAARVLLTACLHAPATCQSLAASWPGTNLVPLRKREVSSGTLGPTLRPMLPSLHCKHQPQNICGSRGLFLSETSVLVGFFKP
jgi:hypothetical protein